MWSKYPQLEWIIALTIGLDGRIDEQVVKLYGEQPQFHSAVREGTGGENGTQTRFSGSLDEWAPYKEPVSIVAELPLPIESLMKDFGCHEPQTRKLVRELIKLIKEK